MLYESTRGRHTGILSSEAIKNGIAPDGGLFVPVDKVHFSLDIIGRMINMTYQERAILVLKQFLTDYTEEELTDCVYGAYSDTKFDNREIAPIYKLNDYAYILELFHGPTCAFKDMALQILPRFLVKAVKKTGESKEIVILVATSGDTGKAALEGFKDVEGTKIIVFYPSNGVSDVQKMQMVTQEGSNVSVYGINGNFDDAQTGVKNIFTDSELKKDLNKKGYAFSSANSINWGRLVPQIVYYFSAYCDLIKSQDIMLGDKVNFVVPTGNFGNILAAYYAKEMGLPINKLICASNENNVLTDFINTGVYNKNREFKKTISPSMDILISSNLERLLFELTGHDSKKVCQWMEQLKETGKYTIDSDIKKKISDLFFGGFTNENETLNTIRDIYDEFDYVVDTHTAVGIDVYDKYVISTGDLTKTIIASTASPFKFNNSVAKAIFGDKEIEGMDEFSLFDFLSQKCRIQMPESLSGLKNKKVLYPDICEKEEMKDVVKNILKI